MPRHAIGRGVSARRARALARERPGFSLVETALVHEELGRSLAPVPVWATPAVIEVLLRCGAGDMSKEHLPSLLAGEWTGALALAVDRDLTASAAGMRTAGPAGARTLTGKGPIVLHGDTADVLVVPALVDERVRLHLLQTTDEGVTVHLAPSFDLTGPVASLVPADAPATELESAPEDLDGLLDVLPVLLAAELLGVAGACLDATVAFAGQRTQFNRPIGSFQAVKHRCAELAVEIDATQAAVMYAALAAEGDADLGVAAVLAKAQAADTAVACAASAIQLHGGIGFTWEHDAHLYYRRAMTGAALLGSSARHRELLALRSGLA